MSLLAPTLQAYFTDRLITQRDCSPQTIASYRDTFRLLLAFAAKRTGKQPCRLDIDDLDAPLIGAFLNHLEQDRGTAPAPATTAWPRSTPSATTRRSNTQNTWPRSAG